MRKYKFLKIFLIIILSFFFLTVSSVILYRFVPIYYTPLMVIRTIDNRIPIKHQWIDIDDISHNLSKSVIRSEDAKFYDHFGFDFEAIKKAQEYNKHHKKKKGASTISQQTAKNVFLWPSRNYIRKGLEAYFTILIECLWPKKRIMEVYLNVIEFGPGVYGAEAASKFFFKKPAKKLTLSESALLTAVLPNPIKFKVNHPSQYILKRQAKIIGNINKPIKDNDSSVIKQMDQEDYLDIKFDEEDDSKNAGNELKNESEDENI